MARRRSPGKLDSLARQRALEKEHGKNTPAYWRAIRRALDNREVSPASLVGGGYKNGRKVAEKWVDGMLADAIAQEASMPKSKSKAASKAAVTRKRRAKLAEKPLADLRAQASTLGIQGRSGMNKAALAKAIDEAKTGKGRKPKPTQKTRKAAASAKKRESQARHGRGPYRLVIAKNNAIYGNLGPYASARAALSDAKTLLRRIAPVKGYALSNVEAQSFVGQTFAGGKVVDGYVVTSRGGPDLNAAAFAVKVGKDSKAAYAADKVPAALRNNGRGRKRRNTLPSWRGASAAYSKAYKILEILNQKEAAAQKRAHTKRGRAASTFRYRPTAEIKAFTAALNKGDEEKIKAFNLVYGHMLTKKRNPSKRRKNPRVSFKTKSGKRVSFMAKKKR